MTSAIVCIIMACIVLVGTVFQYRKLTGFAKTLNETNVKLNETRTMVSEHSKAIKKSLRK